MKRILPAVFSFILVLGLPLASGQVNDPSTRAKVGDKAPLFTCETISGETFSLAEQEGKVVVINFFATWCGPCLAELPHLEKEIYQVHKDRDDFRLIVIGREHRAQELVEFCKDKDLPLPMAPDPKREIYAKYAEQLIPRTIIVGKDGTVRHHAAGYSEDLFKGVLVAITAELARDAGVAAAASPRPALGKGISLGQLETRGKRISIMSGENGVRYTVTSDDGQVLAEDLSRRALLARFPELQSLVDHGMAGNDARLSISRDLPR